MIYTIIKDIDLTINLHCDIYPFSQNPITLPFMDKAIYLRLFLLVMNNNVKPIKKCSLKF